MTLGKDPGYENFVPEGGISSSELRPLFSATLENVLPTYNSFDPSNTFQTDTLGLIVYELAHARNPHSPLDSDNIRSSMQDIYTSVFSAFACTSLFKQTQDADQVDAILSNWVTRLFVVSPVAWAIVAALLLVLVCHVWLIIKSEGSGSILREEPQGLLGSAALLQDSDVPDLVAVLRGKSPHSYDIRRVVEEEEMSRRILCWQNDEADRICLETCE
jgi:hypothetical protein